MERDSWLYLFLLITIGAVTANVIAVFASHDPNAIAGKTLDSHGNVSTSNGLFTRIKATLDWAITNIYGQQQ